MRKKQLRSLLEACTQASSSLIHKRIDIDLWTGRDISASTGIPENRLSEIKNMETHNRLINEDSLGRLISGKVFTVDELIKTVCAIRKISDDEREFLRRMRIYEYPDLNPAALDVIETGGSPAKILRGWLKSSKKTAK